MQRQSVSKFQKMFLRFCAVGACSLLSVLPSCGSEVIHLTTGFELHARSHVSKNDGFVFTTDTGTLELSAAQVSSIEVLPEPVTPAVNFSPPDLRTLIHEGAASQGTAPEFIRFVQSVAQVESGLKPDAVSAKGALGLMQLMPATAKTLGVSPADIKANIEGGAKYLRALLTLYGNDAVLALAAYNAGPGAVARFGGVPPFAETRLYIRKVLAEYARQQLDKPSRTLVTQAPPKRALPLIVKRVD